MYRSGCPLVSLYPSVFLLLANYSILQTQMNINQHHERAEVFPAVIKQWFRVALWKYAAANSPLRPSSRNTKHHLIGVIYGLPGRCGWLGARPPTGRKTVGTPIRPTGKLGSNLSNNSTKSISVWKEVSEGRYMVFLEYWYISGTFAYWACVCFGASKLNSRCWWHLMYWMAWMPNKIYNWTIQDFRK